MAAVLGLADAVRLARVVEQLRFHAARLQRPVELGLLRRSARLLRLRRPKSRSGCQQPDSIQGLTGLRKVQGSPPVVGKRIWTCPSVQEDPHNRCLVTSSCLMQGSHASWFCSSGIGPVIEERSDHAWVASHASPRQRSPAAVVRGIHIGPHSQKLSHTAILPTQRCGHEWATAQVVLALYVCTVLGQHTEGTDVAALCS